MAHKILVVDDEENMRVLLKRVLGKAGYEVECADSGKAALQLASENPFDLAIVDVRMPEIGGIETLAGFKVIAEEMPVIMISACPSWEGRQLAVSLGCAEYLSKPLDMKRLKEIIKQALQGSSRNSSSSPSTGEGRGEGE